MITLGECDDIIATTGSTFSDIAYARTSKLPLKVSEVLMCFRYQFNKMKVTLVM